MGNVSVDLENVGKELVDKIANAIGILYDPLGIKSSERNFTKKIYEEIANNNDMSIEEKVMLLNEYKFLIKKSKNRKEVLQKVYAYLEESARPNEIEDGWLLDYWDRIGNVADSMYRDIWARILAEEANCPSTVSRRLMFNLSLMSKRDAENFLNLTRFCFFDKESDLVYPIVFIRDEQTSYEKSGITTEKMYELEQFSLVETNYESGFAFNNKKTLMYTNHYIELKSNRTNIGNVRLTDDGQVLFKIIEKRNNEQILSFTLQKLQYQGCEINVVNK